MEFFKKANNLLFFLIAVLLLAYYLSSLLITLTFGIYLAMLIVPFTNFLEKYKFNKIFSSLASTFVLFLFSGLFFYLLIYQLGHFAEELPLVQEELNSAIERIQGEVASVTDESQDDMTEMDSIWEIVEERITGFIGGIIEFAFQFFLVFVYVFLLLLYRNKFMDFIIKLYSTEEEEKNATDALYKISNVVYHYLWGRLQVMIALAVMYYTVFLIFGLPYALLITLFGALITVIPYIGPLVSGLLPISFALVFFDEFTYILIFVICIVIIQLIESYVLEPFLLGREVELNALTVLIAVLLGGIIWGVAGMILFVPIFATIKIISNHTRALDSLGTLLGR